MKYRPIGIIQKVADFIKSVDIEIGNVGNSRRFFKASREVGIIVADLRRKLLKGAFTGKILLHESKDPRKQTLLTYFSRLIFGLLVKSGANRIQKPLFCYEIGIVGHFVESVNKIGVGCEKIALGKHLFGL